MVYPVRPDDGWQRVLTFNHGNNAADLDSRLDRVTQIIDGVTRDGNTPDPSPVANYTYMGTSRRVGMKLGSPTTPAVQQTFAGTGGYPGFDRYGRIKDLHFKKSDNTTIHQYTYAYDVAGNRISSRVIQAPTPGTPEVPHNNDRSYKYTYDPLNRLKISDLGKLNNDGTAIEPDPAVALARRSEWTLDSLGNWHVLKLEDDLNGNGVYGRYDEDGEPWRDQSHITNAANEIKALGWADPNKPTSDQKDYVNDPAGNLVFDGTYVYQYDAWNRLVQVNQRGTLRYTPTNPNTNDFTPAGQILTASLGKLGPVVTEMAYDALGRLIAARRPYATVTLSTGQPQVLMKVERYYYDGVRRLQTIVGNETMENDVVSVPPGSWQTDSEYVYGPDYVDEFVLQSSPNGQAGTVTQGGAPANGQDRFYMLQDANYNVMAILDESGGVVEQYQWDPYGTLAVKDTLVSSGPTNRVGHQGLFFHSFTTADCLPLTADGLYYNRNRWYSPRLGRFTSKDPNETGQTVVSAMAKDGEAWSIAVGGFSALGHYGDGVNLYAYTQNNPIADSDPLGLFVGIGLLDIASAGGIQGYIAGKDQDFAEGIKGVFERFAALLEDRNDDLDQFSDAAASGDIDQGLIDYREAESARWEQIKNAWRPRSSASSSMLAIGAMTGLPIDFHVGARDHQVYIGYDPKTGKASYVGITQQALHDRERQHGGKYKLKAIKTGLTKKEARAIEQLIMDSNPHFRNAENSVSQRHGWYKAAMAWARKAVSRKKY